MGKSELVSMIIHSMDTEPQNWKPKYWPTRDGIGILSELVLTDELIVNVIGSVGLRRPELITWPFLSWRLGRAVKRWMIWKAAQELLTVLPSEQKRI